MITGDLRNRIDSVRDAFWFGGILNPLEVILEGQRADGEFVTSLQSRAFTGEL
ncbi:hypothetical protein [Acidipropionibacterium acidipropionici]|uniref:hypothetical protein n=1 Tax=Acidipropionibacterium acidipropionici TaxID=1748 RepID=UPI00030E87E2|nr:hypothetical protein [Acidipropionibacterium acidipropionici]